MNYKEICNSVELLARTVGDKIQQLRAEGQLVVEAKGHNDFVTQMDKLSERMLVDGLAKIVPEAGFIAEESTRTDRGAVYNWIVDPIDGTTNFIHGVAPYCISIGLAEGETIVVGVIYELVHREMFTAWKDGGAYFNGTRIHVSEAPTVSQSLLITGFPVYDLSRAKEFLGALDELMHKVHAVRSIGSAAADMAFVAAGRYDAFFEYNLKPYDVAAGCILVSEAGGKICDFRGGNDYMFGKEIIATNSKNHCEFAEIVARHMNK